jgi:hypothetical protein
MEDEIKMFEERIESLEKSNAEYRARYGTGTRPAWVGEEIGINMMYIDIAKAEACSDEGEGQCMMNTDTPRHSATKSCAMPTPMVC